MGPRASPRANTSGGVLRIDIFVLGHAGSSVAAPNLSIGNSSLRRTKIGSQDKPLLRGSVVVACIARLIQERPLHRC